MQKTKNLDYKIDKNWIGQSFGNAAHSYNEVAVLQREVAQRLMGRLDYINLKPDSIIDVGSGTGFCTNLLEQRYYKTPVYSLDLAHGMLAYAKSQQGLIKRFRKPQKFICGDAEKLPLIDESMDLLFSSLALQWCYDLDATFQEMRRVLKPGGLLMFATMGPDTLKELRSSWAKADDYSHVSAFMDMHDVGDALIRSGFSDPVMDMENFRLTYSSVNALMKDLKSLGSRNALSGRPQGLTGKERFRKMKSAYESYRQGDVIPATYEIVYGHAWVPDAGAPAPNKLDNGFPIPVKVEGPGTK